MINICSPQRKIRIYCVLIFLCVLASACTKPPTEMPLPTEVFTPHALISEILAGIEGNNNYEFIELYNPSNVVLDLEGWSLWYRLATSEEDLPVFLWESNALIQPKGHYLLGRAGQDIGIVVDAEFSQALNTTGGGLELRDPDGASVDSIGWGKAPEGFVERTAAQVLESGSSLERAPGGEGGNGSDRQDNALDFTLNTAPAPQNSGSLPTPKGTAGGLLVRLSGPETSTPGSVFEYILFVANQSEEALENVVVEMPVPSVLEIESLPSEASYQEGMVNWSLEMLGMDEERSLQISVQAPWTYTTILANNILAWAGAQSDLTLGEPVWTRIEGGILPVRIARGLVGEAVVVEGIATMYTGGFYAGSNGTKFYIEDETAGVQVYVPGGAGQLDVPLGAKVRVLGKVELYRGAVEIIPDVPEDVEIIAASEAGELLLPAPISLHLAAHDDENLPGQLIQVEGTATRIEEFNYNYEVDLVDDEGQLLTLYVDKLTEISVEPLDVGVEYSAVGILEVSDSYLRLNPRFQDDLAEIFPPQLRIEADAPSSVNPGDVFTITLTVFNHTEEPLTNIEVWAPIPQEGVVVDTVLDEGFVHEDFLFWKIPKLEGGGDSASVRFQVRAGRAEAQFVLEDFYTFAEERQTPVRGATLRVFIGSGVPIWAIQGDGFSSPYKLDDVRTSGIVTGFFPELGGFWIQEQETDDDASTSAGLLISVGELEIPVHPGDWVEVQGEVREISQQTQIHVVLAEDVSLLGGGKPLPPAVSLDPPADEEQSKLYYEALEGMLVQVSDSAIAVGPTTQYGEYTLVLPRHESTRLLRGDETGMIIIVDDGSDAVHYDRSNLPYVVSTGDRVQGLIGPLAFTFGRYKIEPVEIPSVLTSDHPLQSLQSPGPNEFSIMTWNVENLFDILDPHPATPPRPRRADYELALTKVADTIEAAGAPTVVGLQEVEHLGILEDLAAHEILMEYGYEPYLLEGTDSRGIDVGYLVQGDRALVIEIEQFPGPAGLTSRPPLLLLMELQLKDESLTLGVINNHFTSLAGGELATAPRRNAQAAWNVSILEQVFLDSSEANAAVIGDLNSFYDSLPIDTLREAGLRHVFEILPHEERYTYNFQGVSQTLDHILVTPPLMDLLSQVEILHVNADFPPPEPGDLSPYRKSDHDPVVAVFRLE